MDSEVLKRIYTQLLYAKNIIHVFGVYGYGSQRWAFFVVPSRLLFGILFDYYILQLIFILQFLKKNRENFLIIEYFYYLCNKYRPIIVNDACYGKAPGCRVEMRLLWDNISISYLFRESWNLGNFNDCKMRNKEVGVRAIARAWLIFILRVFLGPQDSRERQVCASFVSWGLIVNLPVSKVWRYSLIAPKLSYYYAYRQQGRPLSWWRLWH